MSSILHKWFVIRLVRLTISLSVSENFKTMPLKLMTMKHYDFNGFNDKPWRQFDCHIGQLEYVRFHAF